MENTNGLGNSLFVTSNQSGAHPRTFETAQKHNAKAWQKPYAEHSLAAFQEILALSQHHKLWLDTGCGTGESTAHLAQAHPELFILGVDKSEVRLQAHQALLKNVFPQGLELHNYRLIRADLEDLWRLCFDQGIRFVGQTFYYPNPWPKAEHRLRRWPLHPVFPYALACGGFFELRTNWQIYAQEWSLALEALTSQKVKAELWRPAEFQTPFERKYCLSGHLLWKLQFAVPTNWQPGFVETSRN